MAGATFPATYNCFVESVTNCYKNNDIVILKTQFNSLKGSNSDKKGILDQAFREVLLNETIEEMKKVEQLITLSIAACREDITNSTIPVVLLSDVFDAVTLEQCELMFTFVEDNVAVWKENLFFASCKNNLLRICNDLLKRFSRAQNTVFCGRILLFLATFFPFSERSGLNIISEFNLENLTEFENDAIDIDDSIESDNVQVKIDHNLYCKFWALQDYFRNPNQCYDTTEWKIFEGHITSVLSAFQSFKLEEQRGGSSIAPIANLDPNAMAVDNVNEESQHFFAKFLTNPKLLALQLSDANFRRSVLVQCLVLFQYLTSTVKFKADSHILQQPQSDFVRDTETIVYKLLEETPPNGKKFADSVRHILKREDLWNNWKNDGCKEFKRPGPPIEQESEIPRKQQRQKLGDLIWEANKNDKFYLGNSELTRLWNLYPDNLSACRGEDRNFLPSIESYLENPRDKTDPSYEWRALRLLARQSPLFFSLIQSPNKVSDYLESVRKKIHETKLKHQKPETENIKTENDGDFVVEKEDGLVEEDPELMKTDQLGHDDKNFHKTVTATEEQMKALCVIIDKDWKILAAKLGFSQDEIDHFADTKPSFSEQCRLMLQIWYEEDDDPSLENLAYVMEGLDMIGPADYIKRILEPADKMEDISE